MQMFHEKAGATIAIALAVSLSACAHGSGLVMTPAPASGVANGGAETMVEVENLAWSDMVVYVVDAGTPKRLGLVGTNRVEKFRLPAALARLAGPIQLIARPIAGKAFAMPAVVVSPGQRVAVTLMNQVSLSNVAVWDD